jgi:hypothetical protein
VKLTSVVEVFCQMIDNEPSPNDRTDACRPRQPGGTESHERDSDASAPRAEIGLDTVERRLLSLLFDALLRSV